MSHEHPDAETPCEPEPSPEVRAAQERVRLAREELRLAEQLARELRRQSGETRFTSMGAVVDDVLNIVQKYPIPSLITAASIGYFLGRLFRR